MGIGHRTITLVISVGVFGFLLGTFGINSDTDYSLQTESVMAMGHLELVLKDTDGNIKQYQQTDNLVVNVGLNTMADLTFPDIDLNSNSTDSKFSYIALGTGISGPILSDTDLGTPSTCSRVQDTAVSGVAASGSGATITIDVTFSGASGCTATFRDAVLANSLSGGEIFTRQNILITLGASDFLDVTWDITLG